MNRTFRVGANLAVGLMLATAMPACSKEKAESVALVNRGVRALDREDTETAASYFKRALRVSPENADAHYHLGLVETHFHHNGEQGLAHFLEAESLVPNDRDVLFEIGRYKIETGSLNDGTSYINRVIDLDPNNAPAWYWKGVALESEGEVSKANLAYREAVTIDPEFSPAFVALGSLYEKHEAIDEARAVYAEGIRHNPDSPNLLNNMGILHLKAGSHDAALEHFQRAIARDSSRSDALFNLAFAYAQSGRHRLAVRNLDAFIRRIDPEEKQTIEVARALREALYMELMAE